MAVSNRALGLLAATAIGLALWSVVDLVTSVAQVRRRSAAEQSAVMALRDSAIRIGLQVRTAAVRDRVDSALRSYGSGKIPAVVVIGRDAPAAAALAESLFSTVPVPAGASRLPQMVIIEAPATLKWPIGTLKNFAILPASSSGGRCTSVTTVLPRDTALSKYEAEYWHENPFDGAAGPCWFLARFGDPGPQVRRWLDARFWDVAGSIPPYDRPLVTIDDDLRDAGMFERIFGDVATKFYGESVTLEGCAGRRPELCEEAFLRSPYPPDLLPTRIVGNSRVGGSFFYARSAWALGVPGGVSEALLAMMVDDLGPTRFAEFWTSAAPVAESFRAVAGMSLGDWYRLQLRRQMREAGMPEPRRGPFWPSALGLLALALGGTLWQGQRRQVR